MASLSNVITKADNQWVPITARNAIKIYSEGADVHSGFFKCKICRQSLGLSIGKILKSGNRGEPYFYHSSGEDDKSCPERTGSFTQYSMLFDPAEYSLPLRINISNNSFSFEIGFPSLPSDISSRIRGSVIKIVPIACEDSCYEYSFSDRFIDGRLTWLDTGSVPSPYYNILTDMCTQFFWRPVVNGIDEKGTMFDANSKKLLVQDSDIQVGKDYYILLKGYIPWTPNAVHCARALRKTINSDVWNLYLIKALDFSDSSADFFLNFGYRLTKMPLHVQNIWPVYIEDPYIIHHRGNKLWFCVRGTDLDIQSHPKSEQQSFSFENGQTVLLNTLGMQQVVSTGRLYLLNYMYLWRDSLNKTTDVPTVEVLTLQGHTVTPGISKTLPKNYTLFFKSLQFNGFISHYHDGTLIEKRKMKAGEVVEITNIRYETEIFAYIGLDCVWSIKYEKKEDYRFKEDSEFALKLANEHGNLRRIPHSPGAIAIELKDYPAVKQWLYQKIREGYMPETAYQMLVKWIANRKKLKE